MFIEYMYDRCCKMISILQEAKTDDNFYENDNYLYQIWDEIMDTYLSTDITKRGDKLAALSGLAFKFSRILKCPSSDYLAGLCAPRLCESLLWYSTSGLAERKFLTRYEGPYRAPS